MDMMKHKFLTLACVTAIAFTSLAAFAACTDNSEKDSATRTERRAADDELPDMLPDESGERPDLPPEDHVPMPLPSHPAQPHPGPMPGKTPRPHQPPHCYPAPAPGEDGSHSGEDAPTADDVAAPVPTAPETNDGGENSGTTENRPTPRPAPEPDGRGKDKKPPHGRRPLPKQKGAADDRESGTAVPRRL